MFSLSNNSLFNVVEEKTIFLNVTKE